MQSADLNILILSVSLLLSLAAVVFTFLSKVWSTLPALVSLLIVHFLADTSLSDYEFYFWTAAALISLGICFMLPKAVSQSRVAMGYIVGAALTGGMVGMIVSHAGLIIGAMAGAFCGAMAYSRTPSGAILQFPSSKFLHYLCAKGLPAVVNICIFGCLLVTLLHL